MHIVRQLCYIIEALIDTTHEFSDITIGQRQ
jgi:hypothetical protein